MEHQNKTIFREVFNAKNAQSNVIESRLPIGKKYSICIPFELVDFLCNDFTRISPRRFSKAKASRYLLSRHIDGLENGELKRNYISQLSKDWKWTRPTVVSFLKSLQQMNVIDIKQILSAKMVSVNPTIIVTSLSKEELDKMAQVSLSQLPLPLPHISSGETKLFT